jgi:hypothetical protein
MSAPLRTAAQSVVDAYDAGQPLEHFITVLRSVISRLDTNLTQPQRILLAALYDGPKRVSELDLQIGKREINTAMHSLLKRKFIHIVEYELGLGPSSRVIALGMRPDAGRAKQNGASDIALLTARHEVSKAKRRERTRIKRLAEREEKNATKTVVKIRRDPAAAWF